ncbi:NADH-quinone oxidoreductase subunit L, partial [Francisella tularensis subsp. holarctica]|nr:NADH-quinone oxidoreductase subunit L [Francisella tularensis subsp. holarctica]
VLAPLLGALIAGFGGKSVKNAGVNCFTISLCGLSFVLSVILAYGVFSGAVVYSVSFNQWAPISNMFAFDVCFTVNKITV